MGLVVFRSDASLEIGSGHIMRCRTLARALKCRGIESIFLCRRQPGDLIALLEPEFLVLALPEHLKARHHSCNQGQRLSGTSLYAAWLGCPEEQDAVESLAAMADAKLQSPTWLVVDHYGLGAPGSWGW